MSTKEFIIHLEDGQRAFIRYEVFTNKHIHFLTTQVPSNQGGQGLGKILVKEALDFCVANEMNFKNSCWYIDTYLGENPCKQYMRRFKP
jgi:predicted GNAT family acetyltransferase